MCYVTLIEINKRFPLGLMLQVYFGKDLHFIQKPISDRQYDTGIPIKLVLAVLRVTEPSIDRRYFLHNISAFATRV